MEKKYKLGRGDLLFIILFMFLLGFTAGTFLAPKEVVSQKSEIKAVSIEGEKIVEMGLPAVDADGNGVIGTLVTKVRPGNGQVLVNVNNVLAQFDTQLSGRNAAKAASNYTRTDLNNVDIIYDIQVNATIIEGPSAGAALATAIVLALEDIPATDTIAMTGTIDEDGAVGPVGSILEKAKVSKEHGAGIFLVPENQATQLTATRVRTCRQMDFFNVCQVKYDYGRVNVGSSLNITVQEVATLGDIIAVYREQSNKSDLISK